MERPVTRRDRRIFGIGVGAILALLGAWRYARGGVILPAALAGPGLLLLLAGILIPDALAPLHARWSRFAMALGRFNARLLLGAVFYGMLLPMGFLRRLVSDPLALRPRPSGSYWVHRGPPPEPDSYRRQV